MGDTITKRALLTVHRHAEGVRLDLRVPKTKTTLMHVIPLRAAMSLQPPLTPPLAAHVRDVATAALEVVRGDSLMHTAPAAGGHGVLEDVVGKLAEATALIEQARCRHAAARAQWAPHGDTPSARANAALLDREQLRIDVVDALVRGLVDGLRAVDQTTRVPLADPGPSALAGFRLA